MFQRVVSRSLPYLHVTGSVRFSLLPDVSVLSVKKGGLGGGVFTPSGGQISQFKALDGYKRQYVWVKQRS